MARKTHPPAYRKQAGKNGDRAFVELGGVRRYLGQYGSPESRETYGRLIAEWQACGGELPVPPDQITITELGARYWEWGATYYCETGLDNIRQALRVLTGLYGRTQADDFGPLALRTLRQGLIDRGLSRGHINEQIAKIRRVFRWGVSHELVAPSVLQALEAVPGLKRGRTRARETEPVKPAHEEHIEAVRAIVGRQVRGLIDLQLLTGARPGELFGLRPVDLDMSGAVWVYKPATHKNAYRGKERLIYFGSKAQGVVRPFLTDRAVDAVMFNPREAMMEYRARRRSERKTPEGYGNGPGTNRRANPQRVPRDRYNTTSYGRAIRRACERAGVPRWHSYQLRHNAGTRLRAEFGLDVARTILGHAKIDSTQLYAEQDHNKAMEVTAKIG